MVASILAGLDPDMLRGLITLQFADTDTDTLVDHAAWGYMEWLHEQRARVGDHRPIGFQLIIPTDNGGVTRSPTIPLEDAVRGLIVAAMVHAGILEEGAWDALPTAAARVAATQLGGLPLEG